MLAVFQSEVHDFHYLWFSVCQIYLSIKKYRSICWI